jgi:hypothetical protein
MIKYTEQPHKYPVVRRVAIPRQDGRSQPRSGIHEMSSGQLSVVLAGSA